MPKDTANRACERVHGYRKFGAQGLIFQYQSCKYILLFKLCTCITWKKSEYLNRIKMN